MTEPDPQHDAVIAKALEQAGSIRRTLRLRQFRRDNGRVRPSEDIKFSKPQQRKDKDGVLDGPIYSAEYWRAWKRRSRSGNRGGCRCRNNKNGVNGTGKKGKSIRRAGLRSSACTSPTSSFAGGRCGTQIFAGVSGGASGDKLLQEYHNAVIQPLLKAGTRSVVHCSSYSTGVRLSHNNPRMSDVGGSNRSAGDGMYDITLADKVVRRVASSFSFRAGAASSSETAIQGISRDTPGAIYDPKIGGSSSPASMTRFSPASRFSVRHTTFRTPGPGHYYTPAVINSASEGSRAVAWTGVETFTDSEWCRYVPPPSLRPWQGFGNGCSFQEHVSYGACLDGHCCSRHSIEKRNALRVLQFLGGQRHGGRQRPPSSPKLAPVGASPAMSLPASNNKGSTILSFSSADTGGGGRGFAAGSEVVAVAGRKRTPLHFASERGELSLVDRLCYQGDDRNAVDERGYTPLHDAAEHGNTRVVSRLLQADEENFFPIVGGNARRGAPKRPRQIPADPNVQDTNGRTPLYLACLRGHERAVRALLKAGACPDLVDIRGKPPQEVAGAQKIYHLLQFKADVSLLKSNIAALEGREQNEERHRQKVAEAGVLKELAELRAEEIRLRAAVGALENKREAYAIAAKAQR